MAGLNPHALARLRETLQSHVDRGRIPGAVALVASHGQTEVFDALGFQDAEAGTPMAPDSIFRIYSMTKPIVSLAALMLVEEGRLQLNDPVTKYLPAFSPRKVAVERDGVVGLEGLVRPVNVHDLLRHTSGLTYEFLGNSHVQSAYRETDMADRSRTNEEFSAVLAGIPLAHQPGSCWQYSRATDVLGAVLEAVTGSTLGALLRERILAPLGMHDTAFAVPREHQHRIAEPFTADPDSGEPHGLFEPREVPAFESGGGGLMSTAADYTRFLQLMRNLGTLDGQRLVSRKTIEWMTADHLGAIPANGDLLPGGHGFGLGFAVRTHAGMAPVPGSVGLYYWSGIGGTSFFVDPQEDLFAILMMQAPGQRIYFRNLFRQLVYAAVD
jgi:CubicO group peptidase (beta-lactamase class C family)